MKAAGLLAWVLAAATPSLAQTTAISPESSPSLGQIIWSYPSAQLFPGSPAVGPDGRCYIGNTGGEFFCFSAAGALLWKYQVDQAIAGSPMIGPDGAIYFGSSEYFLISDEPRVRDRSGALYCLNADGSLRWKFGDAGVRSTPTLGPDGTIYFGTLDDRFIALNSDGTLKWQNSSGDGMQANGGSILSSAALDAGGNLFFGALSAIRTQGAVIWRNLFGSETSSSPALAEDGTIYVGLDDPPIALLPTYLYAFHRDGSIKWRFPVTANRTSPAIAADGSIYFGSDDQKFYALTPDGSKKWEFATGGIVGSSPAVDALGRIYFGSQDGKMYALNPDGTKLWDITLGRAVRSSPAIDGSGRIYIAADGGGMFVLKGDAPLASSAWPMIHHDPTHRGVSPVNPAPASVPQNLTASQDTVWNAVRVQWDSTAWTTSYDLLRATNSNKTGAEMIASNITTQAFYHDRNAVSGQVYYYWVVARNQFGSSEPAGPVSGFQKTETTKIDFGNGGLVTGPAFARDGTGYVAVSRGNGATAKMVAVNAAHEVLWEFAVPGAFVVSSPAVGADGTIYFGADNRNLYALQPNGSMKWSFAAGGSVLNPPAITGDNLLIFLSSSGNSAFLNALDDSGALLWRQPVAASLRDVVEVGPNGTIYVTSAGRLLAWSVNGKLLWASSQDLRLSNLTPAIAPNGTIYFAGGNLLFAFGPDGTKKWQFIAQGTIVTGPVIAADGTIFCVTDQGHSYAIAPNGSLVADQALPFRTIDLPSTLSRDGSLLFLSADRKLTILDPGLSFNSQLPVQGYAPAVIGPDGQVYVGTLEGTLFVFKSRYELPGSGWPAWRRDAQQTANLSQASPSPEVPSAFTATMGPWAAQVRLSWADSPNFARYELKRGSSTNFDSAITIATNLATTSTFRDTLVEPGKQYYYWVRASNRAGVSDWAGPLIGYATADVKKLWQFQATNVLSAPSLSRDGTVYVAEGARLLHALDRSTGSKKWTYNGAADSPLILGNGNLVFRNSLAGLTVLDPEGNPVWSVEGNIVQPVWPAIAEDDTIYVPDGSTLKAYSVDGTAKWSFDAPQMIFCSPSVAKDGTIYFTSDRRVFALLPNGSLKWSFPADSDSGPGLAVGDDSAVYSGWYDQTFLALNADGSQRWRKNIGYGHAGHPVIAPARSILTSVNSLELHALNPDGSELWKTSSRGIAPAVAQDGTIFLDGSTNLVVLNADGTLRWQYQVDQITNATAQPGIGFPILAGDGTVYFTLKNNLIALETPHPASSGWAMFRANAQRTAQFSTGGELPQISTISLSNSGNGVQIKFSSSPGRTNVIQTSTDLRSWNLLNQLISGGASATFEVPVDSGAHARFFRILVE